MSGLLGSQKTVTIVEFKALGHKYRVDVHPDDIEASSTHGVSSIFDSESGELIRLFHTDKTFRRYPDYMQKEGIGSLAVPPLSPSSGMPNGQSALVPSKERDSIGGLPVRKYTYEDEARTVEYWITEDNELLGLFLECIRLVNSQPGPPVAGLQPPDPDTLPGLPLRTVQRLSVAGSTLTVTTESLISHDERVKPSDFTIPDDYRDGTASAGDGQRQEPVSAEKGILLATRTTTEMTGPMVGKQRNTVPMEIKVFQGKYRSELSGPMNILHTSTIFDSNTGEMVILHHKTRSYQRFSREDQEQQKRMVTESLSRTGALPSRRPELRPTEERDEINGFPVRKYICETNTGTIEYWFTENDEHAKLAVEVSQVMGSAPAAAAGSLQFPDPATFPGFPIRFIYRQSFQGNTIITTSENTFTLNVTVDLTEFAIPDDYIPQN
jgi:hypothetical protein